MSDHTITLTDEEEAAITDMGLTGEDWIVARLASPREYLVEAFRIKEKQLIVDKIESVPPEQIAVISAAVDGAVIQINTGVIQPSPAQKIVP